MVISVFKIIAIADLAHFYLKICTVFKGFHKIFFINDG